MGSKEIREKEREREGRREGERGVGGRDRKGEEGRQREIERRGKRREDFIEFHKRLY